MSDYDIAIVGAGMVGQSIALGVSQQHPNSRIVLIDPSWQVEVCLRSGPCDLEQVDTRVSALTEQSKQFLQHLGAWQYMDESRLSPYSHMTVWDGEGTGNIDFDARDLHADNMGHIVENSVTTEALKCALTHSIERGSVTVIKDAVRSLGERVSCDGKRLNTLHLQKGEDVRAQLVVGADGAMSNIRLWSGLTTREWEYHHQAIVTTVECERPLQQTAWQRFRPQGPLAFLPVAGDPHWASIVWSTQAEEAERVMAMDEASFNHALAEAFEHRLGVIKRSAKRTAITLRQRHAKHYSKDGVVLAGDAAHTIHPLAGQGVNLGFKDASTLSDELSRALALGLDLSSDAVLHRYERRRQADNLSTMAAMEGFKRLFESRSPLLRIARNAGMNLLNTQKPVKQHIMMRAMGLD